MNDLISRQAAIEAIVNTVSKVDDNKTLKDKYDGAVFRQHEIIDIIEALPPTQRWIPVTERLPEDEGSYLVFGRCAPDEDYYCFISYFDTGCEAFGAWVDMYDSVTLGYVDSDFCEQDCVLAWMPLPEPFKEVK